MLTKGGVDVALQPAFRVDHGSVPGIHAGRLRHDELADALRYLESLAGGNRDDVIRLTVHVTDADDVASRWPSPRGAQVELVALADAPGSIGQKLQLVADHEARGIPVGVVGYERRDPDILTPSVAASQLSHARMIVFR
jgi:hypothetical protein